MVLQGVMLAGLVSGFHQKRVLRIILIKTSSVYSLYSASKHTILYNNRNKYNIKTILYNILVIQLYE